MLSGHYINLSKDSKRRARLDANLGELGLLSHIKRFEVEPWRGSVPNGMTCPEFGTNLSHLEVISNQREEFELIFEDDIKLNRHLPNVLKLLPRNLFEQNDLVFFGYGINAFDFQLIKRLVDLVNTSEHDLYFPGDKVANMQVLDCKFFFRHGLHAYVTNKNSKKKIIDLHDEQISTGRGMPLDLIFRRSFSEGRLKGAIVFPPVVEIDMEKVSNCVERDLKNGTIFHERVANIFVKKHCAQTYSDRSRKTLKIEQNQRASEISKVLEDLLAPILA